ncbi:hypothetical protein CJF32_00005643 [Rutstroemia sp. NJR-2017a WRK4]|nr:hypothetical protein CJF32_00005643 [Rutstroemia sp. NJR-2017a WRK4]
MEDTMREYMTKHVDDVPRDLSGRVRSRTPRSTKRPPKKRRNRDDSSDDEDSDMETSDSDDESDSDSDSDDESNSKDTEDDEVGLLAKEDDDDNDEGKTYSDSEYEGTDTTAVATDKDSKDKGKSNESEVKQSQDEKTNPYRFVNRSSAFLKNQSRKDSSSSSIRARARASPSERASMRQQEIDQRRRQRQGGRDAATKKSKPFGLEDDDDWSDTDASSTRSSRLSSLFSPRNRSASPSHKLSDLSPLPRSATRSPFTNSALNNPFTASARSPLAPKQSPARISPLQDITSDDALPKNPEPADTVITPPPPVLKPVEPGMVPVMIIERGKREIQWKPAGGKGKRPGDIEMIFGAPAI